MSRAAQILVVDDDEVIRSGLQRQLTRQGYEVEMAASAEEALQVLDRRSFDLILTDLQMPGMDGLELLDQIKSRSPQTPVVMITAHVISENVIQALRRGASDFVPKPYQPNELLTIVQREAVRGQAARQAAPEAAPAVLGGQLSLRQMEEIDHILAELRAETEARCVLLVESSGHLLGAKGMIEDINISALAALVAGNFSATAGIASILGEEEAFRLNYHEGHNYSVYSAHLAGKAFLLIVFGQGVRSGMVLYATRQALPNLERLIEAATEGGGADLNAEMLATLDDFAESDLNNEVIFKALDDQFVNLWKRD